MKTKIMFLVCVGGYSGAENISVLMGKELLRRGYNVCYCSPRGIIEEYIKNLSDIEYIGLKKFSVFQIIKTIKRVKPDLIYAVDFKVTVISSMLNVPYIAHLHNNPMWIQKRSLKTWLLKRALNNSVGNICVSDSVSREFVFAQKVKKGFSTILNVVDKDRVLKLSEERIRESFDIGFIGRLSEQKDPLRFLEVVKKMNECSGKTYKVVMIGPDGGLMDKCKEISKIHKLNVYFTGFEKNPYKYISRCKIILMPSKWEGFGLTAVESMILGKPVLATPVGGLPTVIYFPENLCIQNRDFVRRGIELLENRNVYNKISESVKHQSEKFTCIDNYVNNIEEVIFSENKNKK